MSEWTQKGNDIYGELNNDMNGSSVEVSSDGSIIAMGSRQYGTPASGNVKVFEWNDSSGDYIQKGNNINGEANYDNSGYSISLSSDGLIVAISAIFNDGNGNESGHTKVYEWNDISNDYIQKGTDIDGEESGDQSGWSVSLSSDGSILAIGSVYNDGGGNIYNGHARIYEWNNISSDYIQKGTDIDGEESSDFSGHSVSLSSDGLMVAIGAIYNDGNGDKSGHVRIYEWSLNSWIQKGTDIDGEAIGDQSGYSVSLSNDGSFVAIGSQFNDGNGVDSGHTRVYEWNNVSSDYIQRGGDIDGEESGNKSGYSASLSGDGSIVAISSPFNNGYTKMYEWNDSSGDYIQKGINISETYGLAVNISSDGSTVIIGYPYNDDNGNNKGLVRVYEWPLSEVICFLKGTMIKTDKLGYVAIENLKHGTLVNGNKVVNIFSTKTKKNVVKLSKGSLVHNKPNKDLYVTENHMIVNPRTNNLSFAKNYINNDSISLHNSNSINEIYHVLFKKWILINANNVKCESLCPVNKNSILYLQKNKKLSEKEYSELVKRHLSFNYSNIKHIKNNIYC
tara:strand:+ start:1223 stop:2911 length:1689 start_codon:yes stop_codon:yes gene_type:complete